MAGHMLRGSLAATLLGCCLALAGCVSDSPAGVTAALEARALPSIEASAHHVDAQHLARVGNVDLRAEPDAAAWGGGGGAISDMARPFAGAFGVSSHVSHTSGGRNVNYACAAFSRRGHKGTDFRVPSGTPILAVAAGTVIRSADGCPARGNLSSRCGGGFGNHVMIQHADSTATLYAHFTPRSGIPAVGTRVECGDQIGLSGTSGRSTGPHLHFEVRNGVTSAGGYWSQGAIDPWGGACSSQSASLWAGGSPSSSCQTGPRDNATVASASQPDPVRAVVPGQAVRQTWTIRNSGSTTWTAGTGYRLQHASGESFGGATRIDLDREVRPGGTWTVAVDATAPDAPGRHRGDYRMVSPMDNVFGEAAHLTIEIAAAMRDCNSRTLGRTVPHGSCVQVDYAGCGSDECSWYGCHDGAWICTDLDACGEEQHPHASCAAEGSCFSRTLGESVPDGECVQVDYEACGTESCSYFACTDGAWICTPQEDCGSELHGHGACGGTECRGVDEVCETDADCCDDTGGNLQMQCILGLCADTSSCGLLRQTCETWGDCCGGIICEPPSVGATPECCVRAADPCVTSSDCCGDMTCGDDGTCVAREAGESCVTHFECAGAAFCTDSNVCGFE